MNKEIKKFEFELPFDIDMIKANMRVFWMTCIAVFIVVSLQYLGLKTPEFLSTLASWNILSPVPGNIEVFESIQPKLEQKANTFELKKPTSFVQTSHAASSVDEAAAYVAIDYKTGDILADKALHKKLPMASLTKIMTAVVALDLASPDDVFTVPVEATKVIPTIILVTEGEKLTLEELLEASLLTSANDAVAVIKEVIDQKYGDQVFIKAMNRKAAFLGLNETHFSNPQGYDSHDHYSSVHDLAILSHYALTHYPLIAEIVKKDFGNLPESQYHKVFHLNNWNGLLGVYPGIMGVKIGNTDAAGKTTTVLSERDGHIVLVTLLGAPGIIERDLWAAELLNRGFEQLAGLPPIEVTEAQVRYKYSTWKY